VLSKVAFLMRNLK